MFLLFKHFGSSPDHWPFDMHWLDFVPYNVPIEHEKVIVEPTLYVVWTGLKFTFSKFGRPQDAALHL